MNPHRQRGAEAPEYPKTKHPPESQNPEKDSKLVSISFYTDPLCCWSWAFDRHWKKFISEFHEEITYEYVMCGLIPDWKTYNDPLNSVSRPIQMGPVWMHASEVTQTPMKHSIWFEDPPFSSYPACIGIKTVELQSASLAEQYLDLLRTRLMNDGINISRHDALFSVAEQMVTHGLDFSRFQQDWKNGSGVSPFREDLKKARFHNIGRYPTLTFTKPGGDGIMITGYRPYESLKEAYEQIRNR
jgi:putative protein-disulfide isomerase